MDKREREANTCRRMGKVGKVLMGTGIGIAAVGTAAGVGIAADYEVAKDIENLSGIDIFIDGAPEPPSSELRLAGEFVAVDSIIIGMFPGLLGYALVDVAGKRLQRMENAHSHKKRIIFNPKVKGGPQYL